MVAMVENLLWPSWRPVEISRSPGISSVALTMAIAIMTNSQVTRSKCSSGISGYQQARFGATVGWLCNGLSRRSQRAGDVSKIGCGVR